MQTLQRYTENRCYSYVSDRFTGMYAFCQYSPISCIVLLWGFVKTAINHFNTVVYNKKRSKLLLLFRQQIYTPNDTLFLPSLLTYSLTHSMEHSPSWEANRFSDSQEIPHILCNPKVHYCEERTTNVMQLVAFVFIMFYSSTLHVSGALCTHHQECI